MLITQAQGYQLYCEVIPVDFPPGLFRVHIFTKFDWAKDPEAIQTKMELFFDESELEAFRTALSVQRLDQ